MVVNSIFLGLRHVFTIVKVSNFFQESSGFIFSIKANGICVIIFFSSHTIVATIVDVECS
jgi:hypothetical protein